MRRVIAALLTISASLAYASDPSASWNPSWVTDVLDTSCGIRKGYSVVPGGGDAGWLSGSIYESVFLRFSATTKPHDGMAAQPPKENLYFGIQANAYTSSNGGKWTIDSARVGTFKAEKHQHPHTELVLFLLSNGDSLALFEELRAGGSIQLQFALSNGENVSLAVPAARPSKFEVWAAMFEACLKANAT